MIVIMIIMIMITGRAEVRPAGLDGQDRHDGDVYDLGEAGRKATLVHMYMCISSLSVTYAYILN